MKRQGYIKYRTPFVSILAFLIFLAVFLGIQLIAFLIAIGAPGWGFKDQAEGAIVFIGNLFLGGWFIHRMALNVFPNKRNYRFDISNGIMIYYKGKPLAMEFSYNEDGSIRGVNMNSIHYANGKKLSSARQNQCAFLVNCWLRENKLS